MRRLARLIVLGALAALVVPSVAQAGHTTDPRTANLKPLGHIFEPAVLGGFGGGNPDIHTDIAFQDDLAFQGNWDGFNIRDISDPNNPTQVSRTFCDGNQGDVVVYGDILVRAWNTGAGTPGPFGAGTTCDGVSFPAAQPAQGGQPAVPGWEGVHVFDISNLSNPELVGWVELSGRCGPPHNLCRPEIDAFGCGSHTLTLVPDLANNRAIVYNQTSGGPCPFVGILEVPLDAPQNARWLRNEPLEEADAAHDTGVILGDVNLMAVASHDHANVFDVGANDTAGGSLTNPRFLYTIQEDGVCNVPNPPPPAPPLDPERPCNGNWHSASFTWDGDVIVLGWEPGGGLQPECEAEDPAVKKSFFFYDADDGSKLGQWTLPRAQGPQENCTLHNYNLVPLKNGRDVLVSGNYQAGTWVVDLTKPAKAKTVAWSDPPQAPVPPGLGDPPVFCTNNGGCALTGSWSTHWYNGFIYESQIGEGLNVFQLSGRTRAKTVQLDRLNPQTQEFSLPK
jgi:hypothetical protein